MRDDENAPTLIDLRGSGGPVALDGFDYQFFDGIIRIPGWLVSPVFEELLFEGLEDLEARFFSPYAPRLRILERFQAKSGGLSRAGVRSTLEAFRGFETAYPHSARVQTLVTPRLPNGLGWLRRHPARVRQARPFYEPFPDVVSASDEALKARCIVEFDDSLGPFVSDFVEISERPLAGRNEALDAFAREFHQAFPSLDLRHGTVRSAFEALAALVRRTRGSPLPRSEIERVLQDVLDQELPLPGAFPLHVLSDRNEPNPAALQINAKAFCGGAIAFPDPPTWASDLIVPLDRTASWLRSRGASRVALGGSYRLTTAMALGWSLRSAHGFELDVPTRDGAWSTDDRPRIGRAARSGGSRSLRACAAISSQSVLVCCAIRRLIFHTPQAFQIVPLSHFTCPRRSRPRLRRRPAPPSSSRWSTQPLLAFDRLASTFTWRVRLPLALFWAIAGTRCPARIFMNTSPGRVATLRPLCCDPLDLALTRLVSGANHADLAADPLMYVAVRRPGGGDIAQRIVGPQKRRVARARHQ